MHIVKLHSKNKIIKLDVKKNKNLLELLNEQNINIDSPCGGNGVCGKCRVIVKSMKKSPSEKESSLLGKNLIDKGYRLACYCDIDNNIEVYIDETERKAIIATEAKGEKSFNDPIIKKVNKKTEIPGLHDQKSDLERIAGTYSDIDLTLDTLRNIPVILRSENFNITNTYYLNRLVNTQAGNTKQNSYGIAVDIGTTTIAAYLIDFYKCKKIDTYAILNSQKKYGADIVSRINYTIETKNGLYDMNKTIISCINSIISYFTSKNSIDKNDIYAVSFVGNTTMIHFLMGIPARNIAVSPFLPVTTELHELKSTELNININKNGRLVIFPSVSAYIGADTVSAILASEMAEKKELSLLVDLGTNGEIVLGNKDKLYSCSTAAGPAFEGAQIRNGMGGVEGAIDNVKITKDKISYSTIGNKTPAGICGSGIVDIVGGLIDIDVIDKTGKIQDSEQENLNIYLRNRIINIDNFKSFLLVNSDNSANNDNIVITQKDIRELQNAKAAIAAGIKVLSKKAGYDLNDIQKVYLAGGFGSYINIESAFKIGLIPEVLKGRVCSIGNAAGIGALEGLLNKQSHDIVYEISRKIKYVELSANMEFMDQYINCMGF